jgi:tetratricopeptide (TPR) repeat protein
VGKTRLLSEIGIEAGDRGFAVLSGRAYESQATAPFGAMSEALSRYLRDRPHSEVRAAIGNGGQYLSLLAPQVRRITQVAPSSATVDPEAERFRLYEEVCDFLVNVAGIRPLLLFLDDLQWADPGTIQMLDHIVRRVQECRILVTGTYRDTDIDDQHPLAGLVRSVTRQRTGRAMTLAPFEREECSAVLESFTRSRPSPEVVDALHEETRGNALFLIETARSLVEQGRDLTAPVASLEGRAVPDTVREVIGERLTRLSRETREVLDHAAVLGGALSTQVLAAATGERERTVLDALEEAHGSRILEEEGGGFAFAHPLILSTIYQELSAPRRSLLHREAGEAIERLFGPHPDHVSELAYHFCEGGERVKGFEYSKLAGARALELLAYEESGRHYERALSLLGEDDPSERCDLLLDLGNVRWMSGDHRAALEVRQQAVELARDTESPERFARAVLALRVGYTQLQLEVDDQYVGLLKEALTAVGDEDSPLRAKLLAYLGAQHYFSPDARQRISLTSEAVEMARRAGDKATLADALIVQHFALREPQYAEERMEITGEIIELAEDTNQSAFALSGLSCRIGDLLELGIVDGTDQAISEHAALADQLKHHSSMILSHQYVAMRALFDGRFDDAEREAYQALELAQESSSRTAIAIFGTQLFLIRKEQGRLEEIEQAHRMLVERYPTIPAYRAGLAALYSELGESASARTQFEALAAGDKIDLPPDTNWLTGIAFLSEACGFLRDVERSEYLYGQLQPFDGRLIVVGYGTLCLGPASLYLGVLAGVNAAFDAAANHFDDALETCDKTGSMCWAARTKYEYARMLLAGQREPERAQQLLSDTRRIAVELGMNRLAERAAAGLGGDRSSSMATA